MHTTTRLRPEVHNDENGELLETEGLLVNNIGVDDRAYRRMINSKLNPVHKNEILFVMAADKLLKRFPRDSISLQQVDGNDDGERQRFLSECRRLHKRFVGDDAVPSCGELDRDLSLLQELCCTDVHKCHSALVSLRAEFFRRLQKRLPSFDMIHKSPRVLACFVIHLLDMSQHRLLSRWTRAVAASQTDQKQNELSRVQKRLKEVHWSAFQRTPLFEEAIALWSHNQNVSMMKALNERPQTSDMLLYNLKKKHFSPRRIDAASPILELVAICETRLKEDDSWSFDLLHCWPSNALREFSGIENFCFPVRIGRCEAFKDAVPAGPPRLFNALITSKSGTRCRAACLQLPHLQAESEATLAVCILSSLESDRLKTSSMRALLRPLVELDSDVELSQCEHMRLLQRLTEPRRHESDTLLKQMSVSAQEVEAVLFRLLHPFRIMDLLEAILLEQKLLLVSSQLSVLVDVAETLLALIQPLNYQCVYIPMLPNSMMDTLQCPVPFIIGVHSSLRSCGQPRLDEIEQLVVCDLDRDELFRNDPGASQAPLLPSSVRDPLIRVLRRLCFGPLIEQDFQDARPRSTPSSLAAPTNQETFCKMFHEQLLQHLLFSLDDFVGLVSNVIVVDVPRFLATKPLSWRPFLKAFLSTSTFASYLTQQYNQHHHH